VVKKPVFRLFERYGIELEYILVHKDSLDIFPVSDELLRSIAGKYTNEYDADEIGLSNEFVLHVIELKNNTPLPSLRGLEEKFHQQIAKINNILESMGARLMPSGMHPWMNPLEETYLWRRQNRHIYETYNRVFNCKSHGWSNLQSMHLNISFCGDGEFYKLHSATRLLLPVIPAIAASSPVVEGKISNWQDARLEYYRSNQSKVPSIMGKIIPEFVRTESDYKDIILGTMYKDISSYDSAGTLQHEWLNSRGTIPRFERNAMEIRVVDIQECPAADIAIAAAIISVLKMLVAEKWAGHDELAVWNTESLASIFSESILSAEKAVIRNSRYLKMFGFPEPEATAAELWEHLAGGMSSQNVGMDKELNTKFQKILRYGPLSRRITGFLGQAPSHQKLQSCYRILCDCLAENKLFIE